MHSPPHVGLMLWPPQFKPIRSFASFQDNGQILSSKQSPLIMAWPHFPFLLSPCLISNPPHPFPSPWTVPWISLSSLKTPYLFTRWCLCSLSGLRIWHRRELWSRPAATALIRPLSWDPPYAVGAALEKDKKKKKKRTSPKLASNVEVTLTVVGGVFHFYYPSWKDSSTLLSLLWGK